MMYKSSLWSWKTGHVIKMDIFVESLYSSVEHFVIDAGNELWSVGFKSGTWSDSEVDVTVGWGRDGDVAGLDTSDFTVAWLQTASWTCAVEVSNDVGWERWRSNLIAGDSAQISWSWGQEDTCITSTVKGVDSGGTEGIHSWVSGGGRWGGIGFPESLQIWTIDSAEIVTNATDRSRGVGRDANGHGWS